MLIYGWAKDKKPGDISGSMGNIFALMLPRKTSERVYENGPDVALAGSTRPAGSAEATAGGWRIKPREGCW